MKKILGRFCRKIRNFLLHENWMVGWIDQPIENSVDWKVTPPIRWLGPRSNRRYLADPFAWPGKPNVILCEDFTFDDQLGRLHQLVMDGDVIKEETRLELSVPGHLSFPFLFQHDGQTFLMPESCHARCLVIFRWDEASQKWLEHARPLPDTAAADSILFEHDGLFWIAYTDTDRDNFDNLNLCYAHALEGPWHKYPKNPVVVNVNTARCGGPVFKRDGKLYRVAQNCSRAYGHSVRIMEIVECSLTAYREREIVHLLPNSSLNPHGFHTLTPCGAQCLVDGKRLIFSPAYVFKKILRRAHKFFMEST
jgi:hypothetical protein